MSAKVKPDDLVLKQIKSFSSLKVGQVKSLTHDRWYDKMTGSINTITFDFIFGGANLLIVYRLKLMPGFSRLVLQNKVRNQQ